MPEVQAFEELADAFYTRILQMVWCNLSTVDTHNRPRSRIVQPIWEGSTGWIGSFRHGLKATHIAHNPYVSLAYIGDNIQPVYIDGVVTWVDDLASKQHVWQLAQTAPEPLRYDFTPLYQSPDNPRFGVLKLTPLRIELANMIGERQIWRQRA